MSSGNWIALKATEEEVLPVRVTALSHQSTHEKLRWACSGDWSKDNPLTQQEHVIAQVFWQLLLYFAPVHSSKQKGNAVGITKYFIVKAIFLLCYCGKGKMDLTYCWACCFKGLLCFYISWEQKEFKNVGFITRK